MKVLLVEDEVRVASFIKKGLEENGIQVLQAFDGLSGLKMAQRNQFDVVILDVIMPEMNGLEVCAKLKAQYGNELPIMMLTAAGTTDDIVDGLNMGADDYMSKPFKFRELLARIQALGRRRTSVGNTLQVADLKMNRETKAVSRGDKTIELTAREFRLLEYLMKNKNKVVSRTDILENVWDVNHDLGTNVVEVYINYIRKKVDLGFDDPLIKTVIGMGYTIKPGKEAKS